VAPMLASIGDFVPSQGKWVFEPKYDGIRIIGYASGDRAALFSRNALDKTQQFPEIAEALSALSRRRRKALIVDREVVALNHGKPGRFQELQGRMHVTNVRAIAGHRDDSPAALMVFDLLLEGDEPLVDKPWTDRRKRLEAILRDAPKPLRLTEVSRDGERMLDEVRRNGWEGIMAKKVDAPYRSGERTRDWLKLKIEQRQEFVVGGYTEPRNSRQHFGAVLLGYYAPNGDLVYAGHTGGGFSGATLMEMYKRLEPLETSTCPFVRPPKKTNERAHWIRPKVVVEVKFNQWTADGKLRQPFFCRCQR
jgi:bifunctional non-homologous end joining protein LigD